MLIYVDIPRVSLGRLTYVVCLAAMIIYGTFNLPDLAAAASQMYNRDWVTVLGRT